MRNFKEILIIFAVFIVVMQVYVIEERPGMAPETTFQTHIDASDYQEDMPIKTTLFFPDNGFYVPSTVGPVGGAEERTKYFIVDESDMPEGDALVRLHVDDGERPHSVYRFLSELY